MSSRERLAKTMLDKAATNSNAAASLEGHFARLACFGGSISVSPRFEQGSLAHSRALLSSYSLNSVTEDDFSLLEMAADAGEEPPFSLIISQEGRADGVLGMHTAVALLMTYADNIPLKPCICIPASSATAFSFSGGHDTRWGMELLFDARGEEEALVDTQMLEWSESGGGGKWTLPEGISDAFDSFVASCASVIAFMRFLWYAKKERGGDDQISHQPDVLVPGKFWNSFQTYPPLLLDNIDVITGGLVKPADFGWGLNSPLHFFSFPGRITSVSNWECLEEAFYHPFVGGRSLEGLLPNTAWRGGGLSGAQADMILEDGIPLLLSAFKGEKMGKPRRYAEQRLEMFLDDSKSIRKRYEEEGFSALAEALASGVSFMDLRGVF